MGRRVIHRAALTHEPLKDVRSDRTRRRLLEDKRRRERHSSESPQPRRELRRRERVNARLHQRCLGGERRGGRARELTHDAQHGLLDMFAALQWSGCGELSRLATPQRRTGDQRDGLDTATPSLSLHTACKCATLPAYLTSW